LKTVLCDINTILDIFLKREPFYYSAARLFKKIEDRELNGYLCALSFPILHYLLSKELNKEKAIKTLERIRIIFKIASVDEKVIDLSLTSNFKDFEDAVQYYSAIQSEVDCIITRDKSGFKSGKIPILTPEEFLALIES
jgi:predicted nucleic acid-binding protein